MLRDMKVKQEPQQTLLYVTGTANPSNVEIGDTRAVPGGFTSLFLHGDAEELFTTHFYKNSEQYEVFSGPDIPMLVKGVLDTTRDEQPCVVIGPDGTHHKATIFKREGRLSNRSRGLIILDTDNES